MSTNIYWRPVKPNKDEVLGYSLKFVIAPTLWGHDGSLNAEWASLDLTFLPFLDGIIAASDGDRLEEAKRLKALIEKYGEVEISLK